MAVPNAILTLVFALLQDDSRQDWFYWKNDERDHEKTGESAFLVIGAFTLVMTFILYNRSKTSYNRWWEGGTLLQKTRGEWFNAYSSIMAFTSTKPELQKEVDSYQHLMARLMCLLMCCGLQQVSPRRDRPFAILDLEGIEPESFEFLNQAPDKVEIILQWVQRSMVLHMQTGVLPIAPPILSRAFQEISRGIVNLQNARKIADFPYPYPLAQISMILQLLHWAITPIAAPLAMPKGWAICFAFCSIFVLWCIHFNALDLEFPFGDRENDLPMTEFQQDWNNSVCTLLDKRATRPPHFSYEPRIHDNIKIAMSDASALYIPESSVRARGTAMIKVPALGTTKVKKMSTFTGPKGSVYGKDHAGASGLMASGLSDGEGVKRELFARRPAANSTGDVSLELSPARAAARSSNPELFFYDSRAPMSDEPSKISIAEAGSIGSPGVATPRLTEPRTPPNDLSSSISNTGAGAIVSPGSATPVLTEPRTLLNDLSLAISIAELGTNASPAEGNGYWMV